MDDNLDDVTLQHMLWNKWNGPCSNVSMGGGASKVEELKDLAEKSFANDEFELAAQHYRDAACILLEHRVLERKHSQDNELVYLLSQQTECLFRLEKWLEASQVAEETLGVDPNHVPSLYRHALSTWRGHTPSDRSDFSHLVFWASAAQSFDRLMKLDSKYIQQASPKIASIWNPTAGKCEIDSQEHQVENKDPLFLFTDDDCKDIIAALNGVKRLSLSKRGAKSHTYTHAPDAWRNSRPGEPGVQDENQEPPSLLKTHKSVRERKHVRFCLPVKDAERLPLKKRTRGRPLRENQAKLWTPATQHRGMVTTLHCTLAIPENTYRYKEKVEKRRES